MSDETSPGPEGDRIRELAIQYLKARRQHECHGLRVTEIAANEALQALLEEFDRVVPPDKPTGKGPQATAAERRPKDFHKLPTKEQWAIDKRLGILDWNGRPES